MKRVKHLVIVAVLLMAYAFACNSQSSITGSNFPENTYLLSSAWVTSANDYTIQQSSHQVRNPNLRVFVAGGVGSIQQSQAQLITRKRNVIDAGATVSAGILMNVNQTTKDVQFYAKGAVSRVYDTQYDLDIDNFYFSMGLIYKPNYVGVGVGLGSMIRPEINTGDVGANVVGLVDYPITNKLSGLLLFDYTPPIVERTSYNAYLGVAYKL